MVQIESCVLLFDMGERREAEGRVLISDRSSNLKHYESKTGVQIYVS